jgi:DHA3 family macrolide efflux protein-like MFS transporter
MNPEYTPPANGFRTFLIVWVTQSISVLGSALTLFAINIWLLQTLYPAPEQKPQLAFALAAINMVFAIPLVFGAPIAGAWADRYDRKTTMMVSDFVNGLLSAALMVLVASHVLNLWLLLALTFLFSSVSAFHEAAFDTSYAMLVPSEQLPRANGMMQTIWALSGVLSPAIAASIIAVPALARQHGVALFTSGALAFLRDGTPLAMGVDAVTYFLGSATLLFLFIPSPVRSDLNATGGQKKSMWADIKEGAKYIWHRRPLLWLLGTFTVANFVLGPLAVFVNLLIKFNLAADWSARGFTLESALALITSIGAVGGVVGGFFITSWGGLKRRRVYGVVVPIMLAGLAQMVVGLSGWLYLTAAMMFLLDLLSPILNSHSQAIWQVQTPHELQGRVFSVRRVIAQFSWPLSTAMAGLLGGVFDPGHVVTVLGAILALFCLAQLFNPYLLRVEDKAYLDDLAANAVAGD